MLPIVSGEEMRTSDARAVARRGVEALVAAAGAAVAREARLLLGPIYGRHVAVVVGPGLNGADGRVAAQRLRARGARVDLFSFDTSPPALEGYDLVIDAAFGLGCRRPYVAPFVPATTPVLAVDLPSGVDADSGDLLGSPLSATVTVALGALKHAHVSGESAAYVGSLRLYDLGIETSPRAALMEDRDLDTFVAFAPDDHKWKHAVEILAGSALMPGAAQMAVAGALSSGASMVRLASREDVLIETPPEVVHVAEATVDERVRCVVAGPGLGEDATTWLRDRLLGYRGPVVLDADGLRPETLRLRDAASTWVLTPHEHEFERVSGAPSTPHRLDATLEFATTSGCVVLLKGPITIIANPSGEVRVINVGTAALATAGSGDVLSGLIAATIARGHEPFEAVALAAHLHARAGSKLSPYATASDLLREVRALIGSLSEGPTPT